MKKNIFIIILFSFLIIPAYLVFADDIDNKLKGRILLQVESRGEAWYVNPVDSKRIYLENGDTAYTLMRNLGLGITNENLSKIPIGLENRFEEQDSDNDGLSDKLEEALNSDPFNSDTDNDGYLDGQEVRNDYNIFNNSSVKLSYDNNLINSLKGKILLQVESRGEAWYVSPQDGHRYYMTDGDSAYQIMRYLSLGITNDDLNKISILNNSSSIGLELTSDKEIDTDNDGLSNDEEINIYNTDPNNSDTDNDGYLDGDEVNNGYNPHDNLVVSDDYGILEEFRGYLTKLNDFDLIEIDTGQSINNEDEAKSALSIVTKQMLETEGVVHGFTSISAFHPVELSDNYYGSFLYSYNTDSSSVSGYNNYLLDKDGTVYFIGSVYSLNNEIGIYGHGYHWNFDLLIAKYLAEKYEYRLTQPIVGSDILDQNHAQQLCQNEFGEDWTWLEFHSGNGRDTSGNFENNLVYENAWVWINDQNWECNETISEDISDQFRNKGMSVELSKDIDNVLTAKWKENLIGFSYLSCEQALPILCSKVKDRKIFDNGFAIEANRIYYGSSNFQTSVDLETFEVIGEKHARDINNVFYREYKISKRDKSSINLDSFEIISDMYSKDDASVFYGSSEIKDADPESFEVLENNFSKDKNNLYHRDNKKEGDFDLNSLIILDNFLTDSNLVYYFDRFENIHTLSEISPDGFVILSDHYLNDDNGIYYFNDFVYKIYLMESVDKDTFEIIADDSTISYSKDSNNVYFIYRLIEGADPETFERIGRSSAKDKNNYYKIGDIYTGDNTESLYNIY